MEDLSLHILDIAENSIRAEAGNIEISIDQNSEKNVLSLSITDDGKGMTEETMKTALDPFFTTKKTRKFGLGLSLLAEAARSAQGHFDIDSKPGQGTKITATFQADHIDTKPLGDISLTMVTLIAGHPETNFRFIVKFGRSHFILDTKEVKQQLENIPINSPEVIKILKTKINKELNLIRREQ